MLHSMTYRLSGRKYDKIRAGGLFDDDKVELLNGVLTMMTSGPGHDYAVNQLHDNNQGLTIADYFGESEGVPVVIDGRDYGRISVRDLLP